MSVGANITATEPAVIGAIGNRTAVPRGVNGALAASGERHERRWGAEGRRTRIGAGLTGLAQRFVDIFRERFGLFGAFASGPIGFEGSLGHTGRIVGPPDMKEKTNQDESDQYKLVKQRVWYHDDTSLHSDERRLVYRIRPLLNYPLVSHTRPGISAIPRRRVPRLLPSPMARFNARPPSRSHRTGSKGPSPMASTAPSKVCGRSSLGCASAIVSATHSSSSPANSWPSRRRSARPYAPSSTPCSTEHASARACGCLPWGQRLRHFVDYVTTTAGTANGERVRRWFQEKKAGWYAVLADPLMPATSTLLDQAHNAIDRKLFMMKAFHHPGGNQQAFLTGLAHLYNLIPYQRRAKHAGQCGVEVEGGRVPTADWMLNLQILTSGGFR
jgi:hypothetical protein